MTKKGIRKFEEVKSVRIEEEKKVDIFTALTDRHVSDCKRKLVNDLPSSPPPNATVDEWRFYVMELNGVKSVLKKKNEDIEDNIRKIKSKYERLDEELKAIKNNDGFMNSIVNLLTKKRNEIRDSFTEFEFSNE